MTDYSYGLSHKVSSEHSPWCKKGCQLCVYLKKNVPDCWGGKVQILPWRTMTDNPKHIEESNDKQRKRRCRRQRSETQLGNIGGRGHLQNTQSLQIFQQGEWHLKPLLDFSLHSKRWNQCGHVGGAKQLSCSHSPGERVKAGLDSDSLDDEGLH